jgi:small subunit ribosomal protein S35
MASASRTLLRSFIQIARVTPAKRKCAPTTLTAPRISSRPFSSSVPWRADDDTSKGSPPQPARSHKDADISDSFPKGDAYTEISKIPHSSLEKFLSAPLSPEEELDLSEDDAAQDLRLSPDDIEQLSRLDNQTPPETQEEKERLEDSLADQIVRALAQDDKPDDDFGDVDTPVPASELGFWGEDEDDELGRMPDDDDWEDDSMVTAIAETDLDLMRDIRQYTRVAAWDMPLLAKYAVPFEVPGASQVLRFRYTTYMGETHPAESKVVVTFKTRDVARAAEMSEAQRTKLIKLVGVRYNPDTDTVRMSSEKHQYAAQNKRYLGDLVNKLVKECKEGEDMLEDIPLDFRHHKTKVVHTFPEEWKLTKERVQQIAALRKGVGFEIEPPKQGQLEEGMSEREKVPEYVMADPMARPNGPESRY